MILQSFIRNQFIKQCLFKPRWFLSQIIKQVDPNENEKRKNKYVTEKKMNSIMPLNEEGYAYGHYFPKQWTQQKIHKLLDPGMRQIQRVQIIRTKIGDHSGKVLIKFNNETIRKKFIDKYNQDFIMTDEQTQRIVILPFELKVNQQKKRKRENLNFNHPVRISNMDFDITEQELKKLAVDYGEVSHIDMTPRQNGLNRGFATVYFETEKSAQEFLNFINGLIYRDRKLKAHIIEKSRKHEIEYLTPPTFTFEANEQLMKKLKSKQFQTQK